MSWEQLGQTGAWPVPAHTIGNVRMAWGVARRTRVMPVMAGWPSTTMLLFRTIRRDDKDSSLPGQRRRRVAGLTQYTVVESARRDGRNPDTYYVCRSRQGMRWAERVTTLGAHAEAARSICCPYACPTSLRGCRWRLGWRGSPAGKCATGKGTRRTRSAFMSTYRVFSNLLPLYETRMRL